jgi:hypothetical protein
MLRIILVFASILIASGCGSSCPTVAEPAVVADDPQPDPAVEQAPADPVQTDFAFPGDWTGRWYGTVHSDGAGEIAPFDMELHVEPIDGSENHTWTIVYVLPDARQERMYELEVVDAEAGHYRVDEKNSIVIDCYVAANALHCQFSVGAAMITVRYIREGKNLVFDLLSNRFDPAIETGGVDGVPVVSAYPLMATQRAALERR